MCPVMEKVEEDGTLEREHWNNKMEVVLSVAGEILGLGHVCYKNGGGESYCATSVSPGRRILLPTTLTVLWEVLYIECWS